MCGHTERVAPDTAAPIKTHARVQPAPLSRPPANPLPPPSPHPHPTTPTHDPHRRQALTNRKIFVFGELLFMDNMQALRDTEHAEYLRLLELFAYGTYSQYLAQRDQYPDMNAAQVSGGHPGPGPEPEPRLSTARATPHARTPHPDHHHHHPLHPLRAQTEKLRQLSIVSLAHTQKKVPYEVLQAELAINNVRELEDLIIDTIYTGLVTGKMDQTTGVLKVKSAVPRDVKPEDVDAMITKLRDWRDKCDAILKTMAASQAHAAAERDEHAKAKVAVAEEIGDVKKNLKDRPPTDRGEGGGRYAGDEMDVDRPNRRLASRGKRSRVPYADSHSRS